MVFILVRGAVLKRLFFDDLGGHPFLFYGGNVGVIARFFDLDLLVDHSFLLEFVVADSKALTRL